MKLRNLIILAAVCYAMPTLAQTAHQDSTVLKRELTLEKEYTPTIKEAVKTGTLPELKEPEAPKTQVEFAKFSVPFEIAPQLTTLPAGAFFTDIPYSKKRGYLKAGVSSFIDIDGDLGYQILNSEKDRLSIFGSHRSSNGNVKYLQNDENQKMKINDNLGGLNYLHDFGGMRLNADLKYTYSAFNYYGLTVSDFSNSHRSDFPKYTIDKDINQVDNMLEASVGFINDRPNELNYSLYLSNASFKQKYFYREDQDGVKENRFSANWDVHKGFNSTMEIGFGGYWKNYNNSHPEIIFISDPNVLSLPPELSMYQGVDYNNVLLNPYFGMEGDNWDLHVGVNVNLVLMPGDDENNISPDIKFNYRPAEKINLYLLAQGGVTDNGYYSMFGENRYVMPGVRVLDSKSPFDGKIGVQGSPLGNLWFDVFAGYKISKNEHFFNTRFVPNVNYDTPATLLGGGMPFPAYGDADVFSIGGSLKYNYQDAFDFGIKATYYSWTVSSKFLAPYLNMDDFNTPWGKPNFEADLTAGYNFPMLPIRLDAVYHLETGRKSYQFIGGIENMKNINNLGVSGTYKINDTFSVFAKVNNLLFQKYDLFYGYPAQNFSIMGGLSLLF